MSREVDSVRAAIDAHEKCETLARLVKTVALSAADERRLRLGDGLDELRAELELTAEDGMLSFSPPVGPSLSPPVGPGEVDVFKALGRAEPPLLEGRIAVALLLGRGITFEPPKDDAAARTLAEQLTWLACHTWIDALWCLDDGMHDDVARRLWDALGAFIAENDERGAPKGRAEALAALAALAASRHPAAVEQQKSLSQKLRDPLLASLVRASHSGALYPDPPVGPAGGEDTATTPFQRPQASLAGEIVPFPLGPLALLFWSATALIFVRYLFRFISRVVLRSRRSAELTVAHTGLTFSSKLSVLGRIIKSGDVHIPLANLARAEREVRYPRLGLYAGLLALAIGTYIGTWLVTDGGRAGSPSLIGIGALIFAAGVGLDLVFSTLLPAGPNKHRLLFVPHTGRSIALATNDADAAERAIACLTAVAPPVVPRTPSA